jgi:uncharacterized surface protein with fasciclin (FAS1) repeats
MSNITQVVNVDKNMTTLKKGVIASGLDKKLADFLKPENKTKLTNLLEHHVVEGKISFKDLKDGEKLKTLSGTELHVHVKEGAVTIDGSRIDAHDVQTSNGVIHSLETVVTKK